MDERQFRNAMGKFATGITIVSMEVNDEIKAMTVNAFMSVSLSPKLIAISIDENASMYHILKEKKAFGLSILSEEQMILSKVYAKQLEAKEKIPFIQLNGVPVLQDALAALSCYVVDSIKAGDHTIFIAEVTELMITEKKKEPILYYKGKYRKLAKADNDNKLVKE